MGRYIIAPFARLNLKEINTYLNRRNPTAARSLREKIKQQYKLLADFSEQEVEIMLETCNKTKLQLS